MDNAKRNRQVANGFYNLGLEKAKRRDLTGAVEYLKKSLRFDKYQMDARNLLGLVFYELGETADALMQWVISMNLHPEDNPADSFLEKIQRKPGQLEKEKVTAVYCMPSHQFPSGTVMPIGRRIELLRWAAKGADRYIIEDDYDSEFRYHGKPIPALQANDEHGKVIYLGSFSKAIAPAIRVSFMVLPEALLEKYRRELFFYSCTVSRIDQSILNEFIRDGYFERHLNRMRKIYRAKHELLLEELRPFKEKFAVTGENAGLHLLLTAKGTVKEEELITAAAAAGVKVYGLSGSMAETLDQKRKAAPATVLMGFGALKHEQIREGIRRLKEVWLV